MAFTSGSYYRDWSCTKIATPNVTGRAAIIGSAAEQNRWAAYDYQSPLGYIYSQYARQLGIDKMTLSGGSVIWDNRLEQTRPTGTNIEKDQITNAVVDYIYNPVFIGHDEDYGYCLAIHCNDIGTEYDIQLCRYTQEPKDGNRETWQYQVESQGYFWNPRWSTSAENFGLDTYPLIKQFRVTVWDTDYFLIAVGVDDSGEYFRGDLTHPGALFILIPAEYYAEKLETPYVGPVTKESVDGSFAPSTNVGIHDPIYSRSDYDPNPFGVNDGGVKVLLPNIVYNEEIDHFSNYNNLAQILGGIYRGSAQSVQNMSYQEWQSAFDGNTARPADEVQAITSAIVACHTVPVINANQTSYMEAMSGFSTIAGYDVLLNFIGYDTHDGKRTGALGSPGKKTVFEKVSTSEVIKPKLNCFLDYEPYTSIVLKCPFGSPIPIPPSALYGHSITVHSFIEILSGFLHVDVSIGNYIYASFDANVKTDIPIVGAATNNQLSKIGASITSVALPKITTQDLKNDKGDVIGTNTNVSGVGRTAVTAGKAVMDTANAISTKNTSVVVGDVGFSGLSPYLSQRAYYLITTYPEAAIAAQVIDGQVTEATYLNQIGCLSNVSAKVGDCQGFCRFVSVNLDGVQAPNYIKEDIITRLQRGVYL